MAEVGGSISVICFIISRSECEERSDEQGGKERSEREVC